MWNSIRQLSRCFKLGKGTHHLHDSILFPGRNFTTTDQPAEPKSETSRAQRRAQPTHHYIISFARYV